MQTIRRRTLFQGAGAAPLLFASHALAGDSDQTPVPGEEATVPNMLGAYGRWAADALQDPPRLSFRQPMFADISAWRPMARSQFHERLMGPGGAATPVAAVVQQLEFDGL